MSRAIASARQRRAGISNPEPPVANQQQQQQQQQPNSSGLTLPQVIALVDTRLIRLETFMKETQQQKGENHANPQIDPSILEEYNNRFTILADEIANIKDIVLRLQSYTMEVNKTLLENQNIVNPETDQSLFVFQTTGADDNNMNMSDIYKENEDDNDTLLMENIE